MLNCLLTAVKALKGRINSVQCEALGKKASHLSGGLKA
ncbi:hypothetical protein BFO_1628 [Tannerella forsythia 92A2]|uniref:Uncharacterized protein n=1 Tax=Tannerella forsythia (strain ATCC 43037 / JCM 10827 / CCUG 21028 A / KCTC 5666 / FDC 338) TaxID=203275 RepID=G8UM70_TANFA|nr:hypothetical protein BFO_1628 [Tannerella forsythia 92A2]BAR49009.1 hypothetical protein TF3313_1489 [Tannerella forsythia 3313]